MLAPNGESRQVPIRLFNICSRYCRINSGDYRISCSFSRFGFYLVCSFNSNVYRKEQLIVCLFGFFFSDFIVFI